MAASSRGVRQHSFKARRNRSHLKTHKATTVARQLRGKVLFYCLLCGKKEPVAEKTMQSHRNSNPCRKKRSGLASALAAAQNTPPPTRQATL
jgi:hypothetical protein